MKFFAVAALISAVAAATVPVQARGDYGGDDNDSGRDYNACPGTLYSSPVCGSVDILSLACLDVSNGKLSSLRHFVCPRNQVPLT